MRTVKKYISVICMCVILAATLIGCGVSNKTALNADSFQEYAEAAGYVIFDISEQYEGYDNVDMILIAIKEDENYEIEYQIELYIMVDDSEAEAVFNDNKEIFEDANPLSYTSSSMSGYDSYTSTTSSTYNALYHVGNTVLYASVDLDDKDAITDFVDTIGY